MTGLADAMLDSTPLVCITGQVGAPLLGSDAFQETDVTGITLPITKHNYQVQSADELPEVFAEAVGRLGISETDTIVAYDGAGLFSAIIAGWVNGAK